MKKIDFAAVPVQTGCSYPPPFDVPCSLQSSQRLAQHGGLARSCCVPGIAPRSRAVLRMGII